MLKKIATSLFLLIYISISSVSFADDVVLEIVSENPVPVVETVPEPVVEEIPEEIVPDTSTVEEIVAPVVSGDALEPTVTDAPVSQEGLPLEESSIENIAEPTSVNDIIDILNVPPEETMEEVLDDVPTTEEPPTTMPVEVEENSIFTPPGPEPEPWQPAVREDPTTENNTPIGDTETHSDSTFLAKNSVFTRRLAENVVVDPIAKHSCKVDIFRTDISDISLSTLSVKFYGTSLLAAYDAEIGSLPNGIDVRFEKNNDYLYDFRGKETTLALVVNKQDGSLSGDFTIPIIFTHKGKNESSVICQLNLVNEEEEISTPPVIVPIAEVVEPVLNPTEEFAEEILDMIMPEPEPAINIPTPAPVEEILDILIPEIPPVSSPVELPPIVVPEPEKSPIELPTENTSPESLNEPVVPVIVQPELVEPIIQPIIVPEPIPEIVTPVVENPPIAEPPPISSSDVSST